MTIITNASSIMKNPDMQKLSKPVYPFRNKEGVRYTKQLFYEPWALLAPETRSILPIFSLHGDREDLINFGKEYIHYADPTGYKIAMKYFKSYDHFNQLMRAMWFKDAKEIWDREIDAKLRSEALAKIRELATSDSASALTAAKTLLKEEYKEGRVSTRGRPTKVEVEGRLKQETEDAQSLMADLERIRVVK